MKLLLNALDRKKTKIADTGVELNRNLIRPSKMNQIRLFRKT